jgi:hypothetical protein
MILLTLEIGIALFPGWTVEEGMVLVVEEVRIFF